MNFIQWLDATNPADHCFREDNCTHHAAHTGPNCCCCGQSADAHEGCDCD